MGLWHGASWNFLIWGGIHGVFLAIYTVLRKRYPNANANIFFRTRAGKIFSILVTKYLVFFTFIAFRVQDFDSMIYSMKKYILFDFAIENTIGIIETNVVAVGLIVLFIILHVVSYKQGNIPEKLSNIKMRYWACFLFISFITIATFYVGSATEFIYFQF